MEDSIRKLGPLGSLVGTWDGEKGDDIAPSDDRGIENNKFRETMSFTPMGLVENHEQQLYGVEYRTMAWRLGEEDPFHQEIGYWLWDAAEKQVMRSFLVPRGVAVIAGGHAEPDTRILDMEAALGSATYGICSNPFLDREFKTVRYVLNIRFIDNNKFIYDETTYLQLRGKKDLFAHRDTNVMVRRVAQK